GWRGGGGLRSGWGGGFWPRLGLLQGDPVPAPRALVVGARADQAIVVVLLDDVRAPARDASGRDDRRKEVDGDPERVEERRRVEVHVGDEALGLLDPL